MLGKLKIMLDTWMEFMDVLESNYTKRSGLSIEFKWN